MKKLLMLIPLASMLLVGCNRTEYHTENNREKIGDNFEIVCEHANDDGYYTRYLRDLDTEMIYVHFSSSQWNSGLSIYYNSKGEPMKYQEFKTVHIDKYHHR